jgi:peroxiredoxin
MRCPLKKKQFISIAFTVVLLSLVWIIITPVMFPGAQADSVQEASHRGFYAPDFTLPTPQGDSHSLSDYQGSPVLVFFWASWCSICRSVMPGLERVYQDYSPLGFKILAVNTQDVTNAGVDYFQSRGYAYTLLLDNNGAVANQYRMHALPTSVLIGPDGIITDVIIGSGMSEGFLRARLSELLAEGGE